MKFKVFAIAVVAALGLAACQGVPAGSVGVKVKNYGADAGVQPTPLNVGRHFAGWGEEIFVYPVTQKIYSFQRNQDDTGRGNEEIQFTDITGLELTGDVAVTVTIDPAKAPAIYSKYRKDVNELIHTEVRLAIRSAIREQSRKYTIEEMYTGKEPQVLLDALPVLQAKFEKEGIQIISLEWTGNIRYPQSVVAAIIEKTSKLQEAEAAKADEIRAVAQAAADVAKAQGDADAARLRGAALRANPEIIEQIYAERSKGLCPPGTQTCIIGQNGLAVGR